MDNQKVVDFLNGQWPPSVSIFEGKAIAYNLERQTLRMRFHADQRFCHSGNIVQGGFITSMLDAVMAYTVLGQPALCDTLATLEIKTSFMRVAHDGAFTAEGRIIHGGRSIAYLDSQFYQADKLIASATSTVKLIHQR